MAKAAPLPSNEYDYDTVPTLATELATNHIYQVKDMGDFYLIRLLGASFFCPVQQIPREQYAADFKEYEGDHHQITAIMQGILDADDSVVVH